jgi:hypothetical protein
MWEFLGLGIGKCPRVEWFKAEDVEELADLVEEIFSTLDHESITPNHFLGDDFPMVEWMAEVICGYCQACGLEVKLVSILISYLRG